MTDWLLDTLFWTALLIAFVLLIRRPVARWFGPQIAYALWALPMLRLILPPITLPAWLAPDEPQAVAEITNLPLLDDSGQVATDLSGQGYATGAGTAASDWLTPITPPSFLEAPLLVELGCAVWLIGAAIFLWRRFDSYFKLRRELLSDGREVGRAGAIRFIETPEAQAPVAFGVADPIIALPEGFMAQPDQSARNLALDHELAHHRGRDLLINMAVQPLFALHWWNPLGRYGWLALRRDQEAACDARVMARKSATDRAVYANLIASFAAGPNVALAAPMACPVLGDKSIIHRLRSLNMSETSTPRRLAGRFMLGAAVIALPLTASISYAESLAPVAPEAPAAPDVSIAPPAPPAPPLAPNPPAPPAAPSALSATAFVSFEAGQEDAEEAEENVFVYRTLDEDADGKKKTVVRKIEMKKNGKKMSEEELEARMAEMRAELAEVDAELRGAHKEIELAILEVEKEAGEEGRTIVKMECRGEDGEVATVEEGEGEIRKVYLCQSEIMAHALKGLEQARDAIASNTEMTDEMRKNALSELDRQIKEWKKAHK